MPMNAFAFGSRRERTVLSGWWVGFKIMVLSQAGGVLLATPPTEFDPGQEAWPAQYCLLFPFLPPSFNL